MKQKSSKIYIGVGICLVAFAVLNVVGFFLFAHGPQYKMLKEDMFAGKVVGMSGGVISVENAHGERRAYELTSETSITQGKGIMQNPSSLVGTFVVVIEDETTKQAREVRVLTTDFRKKHN